jgi:hypothetical protein
MKYRFGRHIKRRARLYSVDLNRVVDSVEHHFQSSPIRLNERVTFIELGIRIEGLPLKIVYIVEKETITIITAYPYRKGVSQT